MKRSIAWLGLAQFGSFALQFVSSVVLARLLRPHELGIYAAGAAIVGILSLVQEFGLQALIVREEKLTRDVTATAFTVNCIICLCLSAAIAGMSVLGGRFLSEPRVHTVVLALAVTPLVGIFELLPAANLEREGRFREISLITTASVLVGTAATITFAFMGFSYMSLAYALWASRLTNAVLLNIVGRKHVAFRIGLDQWPRVATFGLQMLAVGGVSGVTSRISEVMLGRLLGLEALSMYNRATALSGIVWNNIHFVLGRVTFVEFSRLNREGISLRDTYTRTVEIITALFWPAFAGLGILAGPFVLTVYGEPWLRAAPVLAIMSISSIILTAITMTWEIFAATGKLKAQTRIEFIRAILGMFAFIGGSMISLNAAAAARVLDAIFAFFMYRPHLDRMTETSLQRFLPIYAKSLILTALAVGPSAALMASYHFSPHVPLPLAGGAVLLGVLLWLGGLVALRHPLVEEMKGLSSRFSGVLRRGRP